MKKLPTALALVCLLVAFPLPSAGEDSAPVERLKALYSTDTAFRQQVESTFENLHDLPNGEPNPWQGKTIEDLYDFLNEWFYFLPNTENGLDYIMHLSWPYYKNPHGLELVREEPGSSWTRFFVEQRGKYMDGEASTAGLDVWLEDPKTKIDELIVPEGGFGSFNEFFIRELKPGARPIDAITDTAISSSKPAATVMSR